ncbi:MAG: hypothetical protein KDC73_09880 [Ignavibacteriae bacterium]|nr:hypothetical protein [Ignavibacteriota bacterium]MCB9242671.1 hypothetical protein [Ignavibacteriales bacterium]
MTNENDNIDKEKNSEASIPEKVTPPKKKKKNLFFRIVRYTVFAIAFLIISVAILSQTTFFKTWILEIALDKVNGSLVKEGNNIFAESLEGNIITGIKLNKAGIKVQKDTLVKFDHLEVKYNIFKLFNKEIYVNNLILENPQINFTHVWDPEYEDGKAWNFTQIFKSTPDTVIDTTVSNFDWGITVENFELHNAMFRVVDSSAIPIREISMQKLDSFNFGYLDVTDLNIKLSGKYFPGYREAHIQQFTFNTNSDFDMKEFSMDAVLNDKTGSRIENFSLVTNRSDIKISELIVSEFSPLNGFDYEEFGEKNVKMKFLADKFDFDDLTFFLPSIDFLDSKVYLDLEVDDKYKNLKIDKLLLRTNNSVYNFAGRIENLQKPEDMKFNLVGRDMTVDGSDTREILPGLPIPDYSYLGKVQIPYVTYIGNLAEFETDFDVRSTAGNANGKVFLNYGDRQHYRGNVRVENVNIGKIVKDNTLESNITGEVIADGRGFDYRTMNTRVNYDIRNTSFLKQNISTSVGQVNLNGGNVELDVTYVSNAVNAKVKGTANINNFENMTYNLQGTSSNLDVSGFTHDNADKSNLNFTFDVQGTGLDPENITGKFNFDIRSSRYADFIIPETPLDAAIQKSGNTRDVDVKSNILDFHATGVFGLTSLGTVIGENLEQVITEYTERLQARVKEIDTVETSPLSEPDLNVSKSFATPSGAGNEIDMKYSLDIKNITPLNIYLDSALYIKGKINGTVKNSNNLFTLTANADISDFAYGDSTLMFSNSDIEITLNNDITQPGLNGYSSNLKFVSDSLIIAGLKYDSLNMYFDTDNEIHNYKIYALRDTNFIVYSDGYLNILPGEIALVSDSTTFKYDAFNLQNRDTINVSYLMGEEDMFIDFRSFTMAKGNQRASVKGIYSFAGNSHLQINGDNIQITSIELFRNPETREKEEITGGIRRAKITLDTGKIVAEVNSDPLYITGNPVGRFDAEIKYQDLIITPDISFYNASNKGNLQIYGTYPIPLPPVDTVINGDTINLLDTLDKRTVDLTVDANNFQLDFLSRYIPTLSRVSGGLDGEVKVTGNVSEPNLAGSLKIIDGRFIFDMTKMYYGLDASFTANNANLDISGFKLYVPSDPSKFISGSGTLDLTGLRLNDINMTLDGTIQALDKNNGPTDFGIYGDLTVGSGTPKLQVTGSQDRILITGQLLLVDGNVIMNPLRAKTTYNLYEDEGFEYTVRIDSSTIDKSMINQIREYVEGINARNTSNVNPFQKYFLPVDSSAAKDTSRPSVLAYNLTIKNQKDIYLRFIVNEQTKQEFFGNVDVDLKVNNFSNNNITAFGNVVLGNNAYYQFYRRFNAEGNIKFSGPITEPGLDLTAEFTTVSSSSTETNDYRVVLKVTGTAKEPKLDFQVYENGISVGGADPTSAAISVILFGKTNPGNDVLGSVGSNIGSLLVSDYLSSAIQDILPFIVNTNVSYSDSQGGSVVQNTDLSFTAQFGDATVRFGGQVFQDISNSNVVIEYPLNKLLGLNLPSNLILQVERVADPSSTSSSSEFSNKEIRTGALIYYRIKF